MKNSEYASYLYRMADLEKRKEPVLKYLLLSHNDELYDYYSRAHTDYYPALFLDLCGVDRMAQ